MQLGVSFSTQLVKAKVYYKQMMDKLKGSLAKTVLFYFYFMAILILSHLFLYYFIHT